MYHWHHLKGKFSQFHETVVLLDDDFFFAQLFEILAIIMGSDVCVHFFNGLKFNIIHLKSFAKPAVTLHYGNSF